MKNKKTKKHSAPDSMVGEAKGPPFFGPGVFFLDNFINGLLQIIFIWLQETTFRNLLSNLLIQSFIGVWVYIF